MHVENNNAHDMFQKWSEKLRQEYYIGPEKKCLVNVSS